MGSSVSARPLAQLLLGFFASILLSVAVVRDVQAANFSVTRFDDPAPGPCLPAPHTRPETGTNGRSIHKTAL